MQGSEGFRHIWRISRVHLSLENQIQHLDRSFLHHALADAILLFRRREDFEVRRGQRPIFLNDTVGL